jgi:NAD(P)-dependent dehydrogenase (short-subunit alcohol dehydrogenase family)
MTTTAITGAGSGIGAATRSLLEKQGHTVIGVDIANSEITADLSTPEGRAAGIEAVTQACGGALDHLVTCAGVPGAINPKSLVARVNYFGSVDVFDGLLPVLQKGVNPSVVSIVSNSAQIAPIDEHPYVLALLEHDEAEACRLIDELDSGPIAYMGSKHALGRAIRRRVRKWGDARVRLNGICPGPVPTPLLEADRANPATREAIENIDIPIGRWGETEDIAKFVSFLLGPDAGWIHGSVMFIDGGNDAEIRPERY